MAKKKENPTVDTVVDKKETKVKKTKVVTPVEIAKATSKIEAKPKVKKENLKLEKVEVQEVKPAVKKVTRRKKVEKEALIDKVESKEMILDSVKLPKNPKLSLWQRIKNWLFNK